MNKKENEEIRPIAPLIRSLGFYICGMGYIGMLVALLLLFLKDIQISIGDIVAVTLLIIFLGGLGALQFRVDFKMRKY